MSLRTLPILVPVIAIAIVLTARPARSLELYVSPSGDDGRSGATWFDAIATIAEANARAALSVGADTVRVAAGTYRENVTLAPGVTLLGSIDPATGVSNPDRTPSTIDGGGIASVVVCAPTADDAVLEGFVITNGVSAVNGGGIECPTASPTIRNNRIVRNHATFDGGGMSASDGAPIIEDNLFAWNTAADDAGGLRLSRSNATVRGNRFLANVAAADGGGLRWRDYSATTALAEDNQFINNVAGADGGGLSAVNMDIRVRRNQYIGNQAMGDGGGLSFRDCPNGIAIEDSVTSNSAAAYGGGIALRNTVARVVKTLVRSNRSLADGGGLRAREGSVVLRDTIFARNDAGLPPVVGDGGGLALVGVAATIDNVLLFKNSANTGGGMISATITGVPTIPSVVDATALTLYRNDQVDIGATAGAHTGSGSSLTLVNAIVYNNNGGLDLDGGGTTSVTYSDVEDPTPGVGVFSLNPLLTGPGPLSDAWGVEALYLQHVAAGQPLNSPCIDVGSALASVVGLDNATTRTDDLTDVGTVDLGYHPDIAGGHPAFNLYRSTSTRLPGQLYLAGVASGVVNPEAVLADLTRPLLTYHLHGRSVVHLTRTVDSVAISF